MTDEELREIELRWSGHNVADTDALREVTALIAEVRRLRAETNRLRDSIEYMAMVYRLGSPHA